MFVKHLKMFPFRVILFLVCFAIFLYQFADVTKSYMRYETTTKVSFDSEETEMPAFYFCLKHPFAALEMFEYLDLGYHFTGEGKLVDYDYYMKSLGNLTKTQFYEYLMEK